MGRETKIPFCDSTVNPTAGCDGCELWRWDPSADEGRGSCFAAAIHNHYVPKVAGRPSAYPRPFHFVETRPGRMARAAARSDLRGTRRPKKPWLDGLPRVTFIGDMADNFSHSISFAYLADEVIGAVRSDAEAAGIWTSPGGSCRVSVADFRAAAKVMSDLDADVDAAGCSTDT